MKRRSFLGSLLAVAATLLAPPLQAAREKIRRLQPQWQGGPRWEHLKTPEPAPYPKSFVEYGDSDAKVVARMLRSASPGTGTLVTDGDFEAAMLDCADHDLVTLGRHGERLGLRMNEHGEVLQVDREVPVAPDRSRWVFGPED